MSRRRGKVDRKKWSGKTGGQKKGVLHSKKTTPGGGMGKSVLGHAQIGTKSDKAKDLRKTTGFARLG